MATMLIYQREPVFTIGQVPFVAGAIHVRNQIRVLKQREWARKRKAFISSLRRALPTVGRSKKQGATMILLRQGFGAARRLKR
ncbi:MAG: hypothetical protein DME32_04655 [Verrucomicrobia bacterium]|nr:MAG: hypothetical protein DME32_04655 [Verrucomicrobiota bacterium]